MNTYTLKLDLNKGPWNANMSSSMGGVTIRQGDKLGTTIVAELYDHGERVATAGLTGYIVIPLPDREHYYRKKGSYANGTVEVTIDETEAASVPGSTDNAYFELRQGNTVIASTQSFRVTILRDAMAGMTPGETYDNEIQDAIDALEDATAAIPAQVTSEVYDYLAEHGVTVGYAITDGDLSITLT